MTTKEWLMRGRKLENRIVSLLDARQRAYDRAVSTIARPRDICVVGGGSLSPDDKNASYVIVDEQVKRQEAELNKIRAEILEVIGQVGENTLATLLTEYYVNGKTWEQVAVSQNYTWRWTMKLHSRALQAVEAILRKRT